MAGLSYLLLNAPGWHYRYIRNVVGDRTVEITNTGPVLMAGGTGVHVSLPSGKTAILTNAHICGLKDEKGMVKVFSPMLDRPIERRVIEEADFTDLCLIEPIEGISGLSVGSEPQPGDILAVVGHPLLQELTMTRGEVVTRENVDVGVKILGGPDADESSCKLPKNKVLTINSFFGKMKICCTSFVSTITTIQIFGGNSGSAAVNWRGQIAGLAYASSSETNWGILVTVADIKKFLRPY